MRKVIIYSRVSTDEQADGCSLDYQEKRLRDYCSRNDLEIIESYREDFSAKDYDLKRPEMKKIYDYCKKHRNEVDKVLFLRWDRFTRNVEFAITYKRKFMDELGVEINAIENRIDFSTPEWATLFPLYCGVAHTEDEKISKRTKDGIHATLLKGKYSGRAPLGYKNVRVSKHNCWVEPDTEIAQKIKMLFEEVAKGVEIPTLIKSKIYPELPDTTFFRTMRNQFYAGYVHVPAYEDDEEQWVLGQHEALIDMNTFNTVQDILDGKRKEQPKLSKTLNPSLYLRKFLVCPICGHTITGATSKGNGGNYDYYFCNHDHKHLNLRAEKVNEGFAHYVASLKPNEAILALYQEILNDVRGENSKNLKAKVAKLESQLKEINERIDRINDLYFDGEIDKGDRDANIERQKRRADDIKSQIEALNLTNDSKVKDKIEYGVNILENIGRFFSEASPEVKVKLIGSMFPEKIEFDGKNYRTNSYNKTLDYIFQNAKQLQEQKNEEDSENHPHFHKGCDVGLEPTTTRTTIWCSTN